MRASRYATTPRTGAWQPVMPLLPPSKAQSMRNATLYRTLTPGESSEASKSSKAIKALWAQLEPPTTLAESIEEDFRSLLARIDAEPVEDGVNHPGEVCVAEFLLLHGSETLPSLVASSDHPRRAALLRLLGRSNSLDTNICVELVASALSSSNIEVRDAAIQAAEHWEAPAIIAELRKHREETPWLADYIGQVIAATR